MRLDATLLATLLALQEVAAGADADAVDLSSVDVERDLSTEQLEFIRDGSKVRVIRGGRRAGKTVAIRRALLKAACSSPGRYVLYISLTRQLAKKNIWAELKADCVALGIPTEVSESELSLRIVGGGTIMLGGSDDAQAIERYRGLAYVLVVVDECGSQSPSLLRSLVDDVLGPALMDYEGALVLAGTPGFQLTGYWYEMSGTVRRGRHPLYHWTVYDNPLFVGRAEAELASIREDHGWSEQTVTYRREYLGEWIQDASVLVYPFDPTINIVDELPVQSETGQRVSRGDWTWRLGVDVGVVDACAFTVVGANGALREVFVVRHEQHVGMLTGNVADKVRELLSWCRNSLPNGISVRTKLDSGGMGKVHAVELTQRFGILFDPADKREKASAIRDFRDRLMAGHVKLVYGACDPLLDEWSKLGWDKAREQHDPGADDHGSDSTLYADRDLKHFRWNPDANKPRPPIGTAARFAEDEDAGIQREARIERQRARGRR